MYSVLPCPLGHPGPELLDTTNEEAHYCCECDKRYTWAQIAQAARAEREKTA